MPLPHSVQKSPQKTQRPETLRWLEENKETLYDTDIIFLKRTPITQNITKKLRFHSITKLLYSKGKSSVKKPIDWENIFASYTSDRKLISRIHIEFKTMKNNR